MKLNQSLSILFCFLILTMTAPSFAVTEDQSKQGLVEVDIPQDTLAPYRDRRAGHGWYFGIDREELKFKNFVSANDSMSYSDIFGNSPIVLIHGSIDWKYNFSLGAVSIGIDAGGGSQTGHSQHSLNIFKYGIGLKYVADALWSEPYVAPYVGINAWQLSYTDKAGTASISKTAGIGYNYSVGLLIQLDWIDYDAAKQATFRWGLENTFINVYATQYMKVSDDFNTESDLLWGAGLKFEF